MLLNGMKATKILLIILLSILIIIIAFGALMIIISYQQGAQYRASDVYYEKVLELLETSNEFTLNKVFDFEFDRAYVVDMDDRYRNEEYFVKTLDASDTVDIITLDSGGHNRILFFNKDEIVFDFIYSVLEIEFTQTGLWISLDTTIQKVSQLESQIVFKFK